MASRYVVSGQELSAVVGWGKGTLGYNKEWPTTDNSCQARECIFWSVPCLFQNRSPSPFPPLTTDSKTIYKMNMPREVFMRFFFLITARPSGKDLTIFIVLCWISASVDAIIFLFRFYPEDEGTVFLRNFDWRSLAVSSPLYWLGKFLLQEHGLWDAPQSVMTVIRLLLL